MNMSNKLDKLEHPITLDMLIVYSRYGNNTLLNFFQSSVWGLLTLVCFLDAGFIETVMVLRMDNCCCFKRLFIIFLILVMMLSLLICVEQVLVSSSQKRFWFINSKLHLFRVLVTFLVLRKLNAVEKTLIKGKLSLFFFFSFMEVLSFNIMLWH